jgi:hypothetical protein
VNHTPASGLPSPDASAAPSLPSASASASASASSSDTIVAPGVVPIPRPPRAGELTTGWRVITLFTWVGVVMALAAVWNTSVQLGLSTWWLGPRAEPRSMIIRLSPFLTPALMLLATINQARWLGWFGLGASGVIAAYAVGDLGGVTRLGVLELVIAGAAAAVSAASLTGTYRRRTDVASAPDDTTRAQPTSVGQAEQR